jgi:hypothetical protein
MGENTLTLEKEAFFLDSQPFHHPHPSTKKVLSIISFDAEAFLFWLIAMYYFLGLHHPLHNNGGMNFSQTLLLSPVYSSKKCPYQCNDNNHILPFTQFYKHIFLCATGFA